MKIDWIFFITALVFLFYPLDDLLRGRVRLHDYEHIRNDPLDSSRAWWRQPWLWVDPLRAFVGGWLFRHAWTIEPPLPGLWKHLPFFAALLVMVLALGVQMHTRRDDDAVFAPIGYTGGLVFAVLPPEIAVLVVVLAAACLMAFRGWSAYFIFGAIAAGAFGFMILRVNFWMVAAVILMLEPVLISLVARRRLLLPVPR